MHEMIEIHRDDVFSLPQDIVESRRNTERWGFGDLSLITFMRTYSREKTDGSYEDWSDVTKRVIEGAGTHLRQQMRKNRTLTAGVWKQFESRLVRMYGSHHDRKWSAPGRGLWFMGTEALLTKGAASLNNCGFVSTRNIDQDPIYPFITVMDYSMCGVGVGWDLRGVGKVRVVEQTVPAKTFYVSDTREGWVSAVGALLTGFLVSGRVPVDFDVSDVRPKGAKLRLMGGTASGPGPLMHVLSLLRTLFNSNLGQPMSKELITDTMNIIGLCSTSAGDRRPAQIGLGSIDSGIHNLKQDNGLQALFAEKHELHQQFERSHVLFPELISLRKSVLAIDPNAADAMEAKHRLSHRIAAIEDTISSQFHAVDRYKEIQRQIDAHPLTTHRWMSNNSVVLEDGDVMPMSFIDLTISNGEPGVFWLDNARKFGRFADGATNCDMWVIGTNPCVEQSLEDGELCCLVENFISAHLVERSDGTFDFDMRSWLETLEDSFMYAKIVTGIDVHNPYTNDIIKRNRRIGSSLAGVWTAYERLGAERLSKILDESYKHLRKFDILISDSIGVPTSIKITSIKPGGTTPMVAGWEGGLSQPKFEYGFRSVRISDSSPLLPWLSARGYRIEKALREPNTNVVYFPIKNAGVRTADAVSAKEKAELVALLQHWWADNSVSCTIEFLPHEADDVRDIILNGADRFKALAFLPMSGIVYDQAPYTPCTMEQYELAVAKLREVGYGPRSTHDQQERNCDGGICSIDRLSDAVAE